jgi:hypothetical protein
MLSNQDKLTQLAQLCAQSPSNKLRDDAATLLTLAAQLDEEAAGIYLTRFCAKWGLDAEAMIGAPIHIARRAPQRSTLEAQVLDELERDAAQELELCFEGLEPSPHHAA